MCRQTSHYRFLQAEITDFCESIPLKIRTKFKNLSLEPRNIDVPIYAAIQCTVWPGTAQKKFKMKIEVR